MPNSTISLQTAIDYLLNIGDLQPIVPAGGFSKLVITRIASDVMSDILSQRFNWKFNRMNCTPFYTNSWQQDYVTQQTTIGWLEHACGVDINNTSRPQPIYWPECVRDLERSSYQFGGKPMKICWLPNDQLVQGAWPGASQTYTNPLGAVVTPTNPNTNITDASGNILLLTTYGVTGLVAPNAGAGAAAGTMVNDGTCVWTVVDPKGQGFRIAPLPSQQGITYQINVVAQKRPVEFTSLDQTLDPIPNDYSKYFYDGMIAYLTRQSSAPVVRARFPQMHNAWLISMDNACKQADREKDDAMFVPSRTVDQESTIANIGPAWPFQY